MEPVHLFESVPLKVSSPFVVLSDVVSTPETPTTRWYLETYTHQYLGTQKMRSIESLLE